MAGNSNAPVNKDKFLSSIWLLISLFCVFVGFLHCQASSYRYELLCDDKTCVMKGTSQPTLTISRADLLKPDIFEITKTVPTDHIVRTLQIFYNAPAEPGSRFKVTKNSIFTPYDMGETKVNEGYEAIQKYIRSDALRSDNLHLVHNKSTTMLGLIFGIGGSISTILSLLFGSWSKHRINYQEKRR
jgi:hypothetical protein|mmetsp:Transcript_34630/g.32993  ORF Transcript_34630/g.32993 Transcript_34630/m.32993 type:complete len:186 (-) Transcript_34630:113-670(-)